MSVTVKIEYFSDVLCIWAYGSQIRMDQLKRDFSDRIDIDYRFVPIFAAARHNIDRLWKDEGGLEGYNCHLQNVVKKWDHIRISPDIWSRVTPESSTPAHLYLKAIQILAEHNEIDNSPLAEFGGRTCFEESLWRFRDAFFNKERDIVRRSVHDEIAQELELPLALIHEYIDSGLAHAALHLDVEAGNNYKVPGSPTLVLNEGRQLLYGNVGYRIIDANVRELLHDPTHGEASWC